MSEAPPRPGSIDELPGELLMWVLIVSELMVFGAGLAAFLSVRITDPAGFAEAQSHLHRTAAALNTIVLVTSGFLAARALELRKTGRRAAARGHLVAAMALGAVFLVIKGMEYANAAAQGLSVRQTEALAKRLANPKEERKLSNDERIAESYGRLAAQELSALLF